MKSDFVYWLGVALLLLGWFLALLPHAVHLQAGLPQETSHDDHLLAGLVLVVVGLAVLVWNSRRAPARLQRRRASIKK